MWVPANNKYGVGEFQTGVKSSLTTIFLQEQPMGAVLSVPAYQPCVV